MGSGATRVVLVCGGRDYTGRDKVWDEFDALLRENISMRVIQGGATGADYFAREWCAARKVDCVTVKAEWERYGSSAGPLRNQRMLELAPDLVLAHV